MDNKSKELIKAIKEDVADRFPEDWNEDLQIYFDKLISGDLELYY